MNTGEILVEVHGVSKKFSRSFKRGMWYGLKDIASTIFRINRNKKIKLRKGEFWAVKDISFQLKRGECLGLIGHNGAGKSTLLKMLNGLIRPDEGSIIIKGKVGALIELGAGFNPLLTGRENIYINGQILGFSKKEIDAKLNDILEFAEIGEFIDSPVQNYSSGMKVKLGFAIAAQMEPDVLIIDEILAVGDLGFRIKCLNRITEMLKKCCIIFVSHSMPQISRVCTEGILMNKGQLEFKSQNIGEIINSYYSAFNRENKIVFSSDKVQIIDFSLKKKNNIDKLESINSGDPLKVILQLNISEEIKNYTVKLLFVNAEMRNVLDVPSELYKDSFKNTGKNFDLEINIPAVNLNVGMYGMCVVIHDADTNERLIRADNLKTIQVVGKYLSWCDFVVNAEWKLKNTVNLN